MAFTVVEGSVASGEVASAQLFAADAGRLYLEICNTHASQDLYVRFGTTAATTAIGIKIAAGTTRRWGEYKADQVPGDAVQVIGSGASTTLYAISGSGRKKSAT